MNAFSSPVATPRRRSDSEELRVLVLSHLDPRLSKGGAEIASLQLTEQLRARAGVSAWYLAASARKIQGREGVIFGQPFGTDNYLYHSVGMDGFNFSNPHVEFTAELAQLIAELQPNVIHLHHYINFGVEALAAIRAAAPAAKIVLTLHEYLAICHHQGQMVKRQDLRLCEASGPLACHGCFPEHSPQDFFLREQYIKRFLRIADAYVAPSRFLAQRYIDWGLDPARISVIENGVPHRDEAPSCPSLDDPALVFGFFGQISQLKGVDVLFDAMGQLGAQADSIQVEIHGDVSAQPEPIRKRFAERLAAAPRNLRFAGPYENSRVAALMRPVHAVIVPSIWWENSPLVIQEALANRRPVLCSDIGGMAEKVRDGLDGFHFGARNAWSLAALMRRLAEDRSLLAGLQHTMAVPPTIAETTDALVALYRS